MIARNCFAILCSTRIEPMNRLNFYIVEDEPIITASISLILKKQGYTVLGSSYEFSEALTQIKTLKPYTVLLDIRLESKKDGIDLALQLDQLGIRYWYLSSLADPLTKEKIKKTNPLGFIDKPFTEFGLLHQIRRFDTPA